MEIVCACLSSHSISHNLELLYALLYKQKVFQELSKIEIFGNVVVEILDVVGHFSNVLETEKKKYEENSEHWDVELVKEILSTAIHRGGSYMNAAPSLGSESKYIYEEEENPETFFIPFVWELIYDCTSDFHWSTDHIILFNPVSSLDRSSDSDTSITRNSSLVSVDSLDELVISDISTPSMYNV